VENPWTSLPTVAPFVLADDRERIDRHNARVDEVHTLRTDAWPFPFMGSVDAPVVLLNLNPGYKPADVEWQTNQYLQGAYLANLRQEPSDFPFLLLNPRFRGHPGHAWWSSKLRELIDAVGVRELAQSLLVLEWLPYASISFRRPPRLPSQEYSFELARRAVKRDAIFVVIRARSEWEAAVPELESARVFGLRSPQAAAISSRNCPEGFSQILRRL
jgi:hypothetical protein